MDAKHQNDSYSDFTVHVGRMPNTRKYGPRLSELGSHDVGICSVFSYHDMLPLQFNFRRVTKQNDIFHHLDIGLKHPFLLSLYTC